MLLQETLERVRASLRNFAGPHPDNPHEDQTVQFIQSARTLLYDATSLANALSEILPDLERFEANLKRKERWTEQWWKQCQVVLQTSAQHNGTSATELWHRTFTEALIARQFEICLELLTDPIGVTVSQTETLTGAVGHLMLDSYTDGDVTATLDYLADWHGRAGLDDPAVLATVLVLQGRIELHAGGVANEARRKFMRATEIAPLAAAPLLGLGEHDLVLRKFGSAEGYFSQAVEVEPEEPHGYFGLGMLAEFSQNLDEADKQYDLAAGCLVARENDPLTALKAMAKPAIISPVLMTRLAAVLAPSDPTRAFAVVEEALLTKKGAGRTPLSAELHRLKGELLEGRGEFETAAQEFLESGRMFSRDGKPEQATEVLLQARRLQGSVLERKHVETCWELADCWSQLSYTRERPGDTKAAMKCVHEGEKLWDETAERFPPNSESFWTFSTRAILAARHGSLLQDGWEKRADYLSQALVYLERALILRPTAAAVWALLGRYYGELGLDRNALAATAAGMELYDGTTSNVHEQRLIALVNAGNWSEATELLDSGVLQDSTWLRAVRGYIHYTHGRFEAAEKLIPQLSEIGSGDNWIVLMRSVCNELLGKQSESAPAWELLRAQSVDDRDTTPAEIEFFSGDVQKSLELALPLLQNPFERIEAGQIVVAALLRLGRIDEAWEHFEPLLEWSNPRQLTSFLQVHLAKVGADLPDSVRQQYEAAIESRLVEPSIHEDDELRDWYEAFGRYTGKNAQLAVKAAIARRASVERRHFDALLEYQSAEGAAETREFSLAVEREGFELARDADSWARSGSPDVAHWAYEVAVDACRKFGQDVRPYVMRVAHMNFELGRMNEAWDLLLTVLSGPDPLPAARAASALTGLFPDSESVLRLIQRVLETEDKYPEAASTLKEFRAALGIPLSDHLGLREPTGLTNVGAPLVIELSEDLLELKADMAQLGLRIRDFREYLSAHLGFGFPAVKIRRSASSAGQSRCTVRLHEAAVSTIMFSIRDAEPFSVASVNFERCVRKFLHDFVGVRETEVLLAEWANDPKLQPFVDPLLRNPSSLPSVAGLLRRMMQQRVPITNPEVILECIHRAAPCADNDAWLRPVRARLRDWLPGNRESDARLELPSGTEDAMLVQLRGHSMGWFLAAPRATTAGWRTTIRDCSEEVRAAGIPAAFVVREPKLRHPLEDFLHQSFLDIYAIAQDEVLTRKRQSFLTEVRDHA